MRRLGNTTINSRVSKFRCCSNVMLTRLSKQHRDRENNKSLYELLVIVVVEIERAPDYVMEKRQYMCVYGYERIGMKTIK